MPYRFTARRSNLSGLALILAGKLCAIGPWRLPRPVNPCWICFMMTSGSGRWSTRMKPRCRFLMSRGVHQHKNHTCGFSEAGHLKSRLSFINIIRPGPATSPNCFLRAIRVLCRQTATRLMIFWIPGLILSMWAAGHTPGGSLWMPRKLGPKTRPAVQIRLWVWSSGFTLLRRWPATRSWIQWRYMRCARARQSQFLRNSRSGWTKEKTRFHRRACLELLLITALGNGAGWRII